MSRAKMAEPTDWDAFWGGTYLCWPKEPLLDGYEYDGSSCVAVVMHPLTAVTVATCFKFLFILQSIFFTKFTSIDG